MRYHAKRRLPTDPPTNKYGAHQYVGKSWKSQPAEPLRQARKHDGSKTVSEICVELAVDPAKCLSFRAVADELSTAAALATDEQIYAQRMRHPFLQVDLTRRIDSFGLTEFGTSHNRSVSQATATRLLAIAAERQLILLRKTGHRNNPRLAVERALFLHHYNNRKKKFYESE